MKPQFEKDPHATLDYAWDWSAWLANGETIQDAEVLAPYGLNVEAPVVENGKVTAWISGGVEGRQYTVTCRVTTSAGRVDDRSILLVVENR
jgi:hypothetical protein